MMVDFKRFWELSTGVGLTPLIRGERPRARIFLPSNKRGWGCVKFNNRSRSSGDRALVS